MKWHGKDGKYPNVLMAKDKGRENAKYTVLVIALGRIYNIVVLINSMFAICGTNAS